MQGLNDVLEATKHADPVEGIRRFAQASGDLMSAYRGGQMPAEFVDEARTIALSLLEQGVGTGRLRLSVGEFLGVIGDPRLRRPQDADYWVTLQLESGDEVRIGRYQVTNQEYREFVMDGGYRRKELWSEEGWDWVLLCEDPWPMLASRKENELFTVPNQPVVGVTWFEAEAFANYHGARLLRWYERVRAVRGTEKRKYPWGSPFGEGNTNSKEEVLRRPCAVGLFPRDVTPEGIFDLAANAGEWTADAAGEEQLLHPGSWESPSLAAWAKALTSQPRHSRSGSIGFRLASDLD